MVPNLISSPAPPRSTLAKPSPPSPGPPPCRRFALPPNVGGRSPPTAAPWRTSPPALASVRASGPPAGGDSRASGNASVCACPWANLAWRRGSFFSKLVRHLAELLGHVEAINHRLAVGQRPTTSLQVRRPHVGMVITDIQALLLRQRLQALLA